MAHRKPPWKRNFLRVPAEFKARVEKFDSDLFVVAATKKIPISDIQDGVYEHLCVTLDGGSIRLPKDPVVPPANMGKWSRRNREGWERKRTDLPKITKTFTWETPNFGDASVYGTHWHYQDRQVYPIESFEPRQYTISARLPHEPGTDTAWIIFGVERTLDRNEPSLDYDFLLCLNLLQENAGIAGVHQSNSTREEYIGTIALDWEVFPPGTAEEVVAKLRRGRRALSEQMRAVTEERVRLFSSLEPTAYLRGSGSFSSYVGAQFADDLVVFENLNYGNALYVLYEDWAEVSRRSRIDLLKGTSTNFDRFPHTEGWEDRFRSHMRRELGKRKHRR